MQSAERSSSFRCLEATVVCLTWLQAGRCSSLTTGLGVFLQFCDSARRALKPHYKHFACSTSVGMFHREHWEKGSIWSAQDAVDGPSFSRVPHNGKDAQVGRCDSSCNPVTRLICYCLRIRVHSPLQSYASSSDNFLFPKELIVSWFPLTTSC